MTLPLRLTGIDDRRTGFAFGEEHEMFRRTVQRFIETVLAPGNAQWEKDGTVPRAVWRQAGELGLLCTSVDDAYGGVGGDPLFDVVFIEELSRAGLHGPLAGFMVHSNIVSPYLTSFGSDEQRQRWLPKMATGEVVAALAMTEPAAGSDLRGMQTRARRDGAHYVVSGQKTFISNGQAADLVVLAAKLDDTPSDSVSLFLVPADTAGFARGKTLEKIGLKAQDTSELFFDEVRLPADALLGEAGRGMRYLSANLAVERLFQAIRSAAAVEAVIEWTVAYTSERKAFGQMISDFQNTQFKLADLASKARVLRAFIDSCIVLHLEGKLDSTDAAIAKLRATELHCEATDECLQLHGGWGYVWETPIARAFADGRVAKIAAGSVEVMKMLIARALFPARPKAVPILRDDRPASTSRPSDAKVVLSSI